MFFVLICRFNSVEFITGSFNCYSLSSAQLRVLVKYYLSLDYSIDDFFLAACRPRQMFSYKVIRKLSRTYCSAQAFA